MTSNVTIWQLMWQYDIYCYNMTSTVTTWHLLWQYHTYCDSVTLNVTIWHLMCQRSCTVLVRQVSTARETSQSWTSKQHVASCSNTSHTHRSVCRSWEERPASSAYTAAQNDHILWTAWPIYELFAVRHGSCTSLKLNFQNFSVETIKP